MARRPQIERFNEVVKSKFQIYNSLFLTLPFPSIKNTALLLPLFAETCKEGFAAGLSPNQIVTNFFDTYLKDIGEKDRNDLLFSFIKYIERQVVLFDAIEDAGFSYVNNMHGRGTLRYIKEEAQNNNKYEDLLEYLERFAVRVVLTAHPTQFYPNSVLGIIRSLSVAVKRNDIDDIKQLLDQLGLTPFYNKAKPSPLDEANGLIWYLENVFYHSAGSIVNYLRKNFFDNKVIEHRLFDFGFWPGGDRDGNPFVTSEITMKTAQTLRHHIQRNYYREIRDLKTRLTFKGILERVEELETRMYHTLFFPELPSLSLEELEAELQSIHLEIKKKHSGLYEDLVLDLIQKVKLFGYHFASLDLRQDSRIHEAVFAEIINHPMATAHIENLPSKPYAELSLEEKYEVLIGLKGSVSSSWFDADSITAQTIDSIYVMKQIQAENGELGANRYIISNCQ